jgi:hypothetical protein
MVQREDAYECYGTISCKSEMKSTVERQHIFSSVRLGWGPNAVPIQQRLCRFCQAVSRYQNMLLCNVCQMNIPLILRNELFRISISGHGDWTTFPTSLSDSDALLWMKCIFFDWELVKTFGKYLHEVSEH